MTKKYIISNCPCYTYPYKFYNCSANCLGYMCEDNQDCPIRQTYEDTNDETIFTIEEVE